MPTTIASLLIKVGVQFKDAKKGFKNIEKNFKGFQKSANGIKVSTLALGTALGSGLVKAAELAVQGLGHAITSAAEFQTELANLSRVSGTTGQDLETIGKSALKLSSKLGISAKHVVEGLTDFAKLGYTAQESLEGLPPILKLAKVKGLDFGKSLKAVENAVSVFKLGIKGASRVSETFLYTMDHSLASLDDLKQGFKYSAPAAHALGLTVEELSASIAVLANRGTTGSTAGTTLRRAFERLASNNPKVTKTFKDLGVAITDANGKFRPGVDIIDDLTAAFARLSPKQQLATANMLFGVNAGSNMLKILQQSPGEFRKFVEGANEAGGALDKNFNEKQKTFAATWDRFKISLENFGIGVGKYVIPPLTDFLDWLNNLGEGFDDLIEDMKKENAERDSWAVSWQKTKDSVSSAWEDMKNEVSKFSEGTAEAISKDWDKIVNDTSSMFDSISGYFSNLVSSAVSWGSSIASNFASGLRSAGAAVGKAASKLAGIAASYLKSHSPPEKGPLSDSDKWMPNFVHMLAKGIEMGIPEIQMAASGIASGLEVVQAGALTSTNNFNIYPRQTNLDAKGLNREMERMRWLNGGML